MQVVNSVKWYILPTYGYGIFVHHDVFLHLDK